MRANMTVKNYPGPRNRQSGVVLVVALFIMALVSAIAVIMINRLDRDIRRTMLWSHNIQAEQYAEGSILWAEELLKNNWLKQKPGQLVDVMPVVSPLEEAEGYSIQSSIEDMQARFNLNNLAQESAQSGFKWLLRVVNPSLSEAQAEELLKATTIFLGMVPPSPERLESIKYYTNLSLPYQPSGRLLVSVSEWRLVKGVTPSLYESMRPYLTALPDETPINVQTASAPVLASLAPGLSMSFAKEIIDLRLTTPFVSKEMFGNLPIVKNHEIPAGLVTVVSHFFLVKTEVNQGEQKVVLYTLLERSQAQGKVEIIKHWQSKGIW